MKQDPIVAQVRRVRGRHARKHRNDVDAIFKDMEQWEARQGRKSVSLPAKKPLRPTG
jgi:hypothetical protein